MGIKRLKNFARKASATQNARVLVQDSETGETYTIPFSGSSSGSSSPSSSNYINAYDSSGNTDVTSGAVVNLNSVRNSSQDFSLNGNEVSYSGQSSLFLVQANVSTDTGGGRDNSFFYIEKSTDNGSTWSEVGGTRGFMYNRTSGNGESSGATSAILQMESGDRLRLRAESLNASGPVTTIEDGSAITLLSIT